jgi:DNA polymerase-3 subunit gamma/tau
VPDPVPDPVPEPRPAPAPDPAPVPPPTAGPTPEPTPEPAPRAEPATPSAAPAAGTLGLADVRRIWPDLLEKVKEKRRFTWILLSQNAQVVGLDRGVLTVGLKNAGARESFVGGGSDEVLREAARELVGADWQVDAIIDPSADPEQQTAPRVTRPAVVRQAPAEVREGIVPTRSADQPPPKPAVDADADAHPDDRDADDSGLDSQALLERELGATVIEEITHESAPTKSSRGR